MKVEIRNYIARDNEYVPTTFHYITYYMKVPSIYQSFNVHSSSEQRPSKWGICHTAVGVNVI